MIWKKCVNVVMQEINSSRTPDIMLLIFGTVDKCPNYRGVLIIEVSTFQSVNSTVIKITMWLCVGNDLICYFKYLQVLCNFETIPQSCRDRIVEASVRHFALQTRTLVPSVCLPSANDGPRGNL